MPQKLTNEIIVAAIAGFEVQKRHSDSQIADLRAMLNGGGTSEAGNQEAPKRKRRSAAARRRMAEAQKLRWAKIKGESESPQPSATKRGGRKKSVAKAAATKIAATTAKKTAAKRPARVAPASAQAGM